MESFCETLSQTAWVNHCAHSLSLLSKCANGFKSPHITSVYKRAAQLTQGLSLAQSRQCRVITKVYKLHFFFILASFKPFSVHALSWRPCAHAHSKRTHNARFTHTHAHTLTLRLHCVCGQRWYFLRAHVNGSECSYCTQLWSGSAFQEQCVSSSAALVSLY